MTAPRGVGVRALCLLTVATVWAAGGGGLTMSAGSPAGAAPAGAWVIPTEVPLPTGGAVPSNAGFSGVSCADATNCIAVGQDSNDQPISATESDGVWTAAVEVTVPAVMGGGGSFTGVSCPDAADCTAVGFDRNDQPIADVDSAGSWSTPTEVAGAAGGGGAFTGVSCADATDCTAVGTDNDLQPFTAAETEGNWGVVGEDPVPALMGGSGTFDGLSCADATDCTAVGSDADSQPVTATEAGGTWGVPTPVAGTPGGGGALVGVSCTDAADCSAVGSDTAHQPIAVTETVGVWGTPAEIAGALGGGGTIVGVSCTSTGACTAVGTDADNQPISTTETAGVWGTPAEIAGALGGGGSLVGISCTSTGACTAVGTDADDQPIFTTVAAPAPAPTVTAVTPTSGPTTGGTPVTVSGIGFATTPGATIIDVGSVPATGVVCVSSVSCTATTPPGPAGAAGVSASVAGFTSSGGPSYTYVAPPLVVTGVSPTSGPTVGGTPVTISGTGFSTAPDGSSFAFGADPATDVVCQSATSCTADTPAEGAGAAVISATVAGQVFADGPHFTYKLTPTVSWATPPPITYGTRLGPNQLHATSPSAGTFTYNPPAATVLGAGTHTLSATFTPTDTATYATVTDRVTLTVDRAPPAVTWAMPAPVAYGSVLGSTQLDAGASVPGSFVYTPPAGTRLSPGAHTLSATFTPTDTADYAAETVTSTQSVTPAPTTTALTVLSPITFGNEAVEVFSVTVTTASGVTPTGTATVTATATTNAATKVCTIVLRAGAGHCSPTSTQLAIGAYQVTVAYTPSADFVASAFPGARVIVSPPGTGLARWGAYSSPTALPYEADTPTLILGGVSHATTIAAGNSSDMALDGAGTVWVWGDGIGGELGQGNTTNHPASAVKVPLPWPATAIGEADNTDVAISATGSVMGWGANASGQLCLGNQTQQHSPVPIPSLSNVVAAAGGGTHMLYLLSDGSLEACGTNHYGELGDGTVTSASTPVAVVGLPDSPVVAISAASSTSAALLANGQVWMWGSGAFGQLGDGSTRKSDVPVEVQLPSAAVEISCGGDLLGIGQSLALLANGQVYGWGNDQYGQLGNGAAVNTVELPEPITGAGHVVFTQVVSGGESGYGVSASGEVWAWGSNAEGQIGNAQSNGIVLNPEMIWNNVASVSATAHDVVVLRKSKT